MPECLIEFCRVTLTFESVDKILWRHCDHSNQSSLPACTFTWYYLFLKMLGNEIWKFGRNLPLATFGKERVKNNRKTKITWDKKINYNTITCTCYWADWSGSISLFPSHYHLLSFTFNNESNMKVRNYMPMIFWAKQQLKIIMHQSLLYNYKVKLPKVTFLIIYMYRRWGAKK